MKSLAPGQRRLVLADLDEQRLHRRGRRLDGVAGLQTGEDLDPAGALVLHLQPRPFGGEDRLHQDRHANLRRAGRIESSEAGGRDAHHRHRVVVDQHLRADHVAVAVEAPLPVVVAQHHDRVALEDLVVLLRVEDAAQRRGHAEHGEVVARHQLGVEPLGLVVDAHRGLDQAAGQHLAQRFGALLVLPVDGVRLLADPHVVAGVRPLLVEHHQALGVAHRQLAQQDLVDQREDRGVGADAEGQREDRDRGEERAAAEAAQRQAEVVGRKGHRRLRRRPAGRGCDAGAGTGDEAGPGAPSADACVCPAALVPSP